MNILAIETSCDETAISIIETNESSGENTLSVLANVVVSQIDIISRTEAYSRRLPKENMRKILFPY